MTRYHTGAASEREVGELLEAEGYVVGRAAGSHGPADLTAMKLGEPTLLVQVKGGNSNTFNGFGPADRHKLRVAAIKAGATPVLCKWDAKAHGWKLVGEKAWPPDQPVCHRPDYLVDEDTDCWIWQKATMEDGYAVGRRNGRSWLMHRWYYEQHIGPIPDGLQIDHLCRVRCCVNPAHLEPVTQTENRLRGDLTKLTAGQVRAIRASAEDSSVLAGRYGITRSYVWRIRTLKARLDVK